MDVQSNRDQVRSDQVIVRVGIGSSKHKVVGVEQIHWNKLYNVGNRNHVSQNDVVLLELNETLEFSAYVGWVCIPNTRLDVRTERSGKVSGYGLTNREHWWKFWHDKEYPSSDLRTDTLKINKYSNLGIYSGQSETQQLADGDSGAGFVVQENQVHYAYGIFSSRTIEKPPYKNYYVALNSYCDRLLNTTENKVRCVDPTKMSSTCDEG
ncbi:hypothetical protein FO519_003514 [Halicephalobus sp. NKZ332]|nr:hypothetical protein FO519_003514 [Halicephalobus sp. NKZ332]